MKSTVLGLVVLAGALSQHVAAATPPEDIIAKFFPPALTKTAAGDVPSPERNSSFAVGALHQNGTPVIVAAYTNGVAAAVSVLSSEGLGSEIATIAPVDMTGREAEVEIVNLGAGPRILVRMHQERGLPTAWLFALSSHALVLDGPTRSTRSGRRVSDLVDPTIVDLEGAGALAIVDHRAGQSSSEDGSLQSNETYRLFRMVGGTFRQSSVDYFKTFMRSTGPPSTQKSEFSLRDAATARQIIIINGRRDGGSRVTSGRIALNGEVLATPRSLNGHTSTRRVSVTLKQTNFLEVKLDGEPDSEITLIVMPSR